MNRWAATVASSSSGFSLIIFLNAVSCGASPETAATSWKCSRDLDARGYQARAVALDLAGRAQIGDVGDAQRKERPSAVVGEVAQLTGPEEPARRNARLLRDITKVPRPRQLPDHRPH